MVGIDAEGLKGNPVPVSSTPRPDFQLQSPSDCFVEVSTLNVSDKDKKNFERGESVSLDHAETIRRIIGKITEEKKRQLMYAAAERKPCVLAFFDYTTWSGFATLFYRTLARRVPSREAAGVQNFPCRVVCDRLLGAKGSPRWQNRPQP